MGGLITDFENSLKTPIKINSFLDFEIVCVV